MGRRKTELAKVSASLSAAQEKRRILLTPEWRRAAKLDWLDACIADLSQRHDALLDSEPTRVQLAAKVVDEAFPDGVNAKRVAKALVCSQQAARKALNSAEAQGLIVSKKVNGGRRYYKRK